MIFKWLFTPISAGELWCRLPVVDRETRNLSLMRCGACVGLACWCHVVDYAHAFTWSSVAVLGVITVMMLAKKMDDLKQGFAAIGGAFRRRSTDARRLADIPAERRAEGRAEGREGER